MFLTAFTVFLSSSAKYVEDARTLDPYEQICTFKKPVLIIHGIEDKLVKIEYSRKANERYDDCELIEVHGDHGFILKGFKAGKKATEKYLSDLD